MKLATWNVRNLMDNDKRNCPERQTAFITSELPRHNVDIAALQETRLADEGQLTEIGGGYTFLWRGLSSEQRRLLGVRSIKNEIMSHMEIFETGVNEQVMIVQRDLNHHRKATLISAYAPTLLATSEEKDFLLRSRGSHLQHS